ncbi:MAG: glycosyltransferase family 4 protein [Clostridia bacterium]|nr:glycosyltransferase family 4 protein [Clostridia bacterium]
MNNAIAIITSYDGPYGGNFIASIKALDKKIKDNGYKTVYIFQRKVKDFSWIQQVIGFADKVYFLEYKPNSLSNVKEIRKILLSENVKLIYSRMGGWDLAAHFAALKLPIVWHMEMEPNLSVKSKRIKYFGKYRILSNKNVYSVAVSNPGADTLNTLNLKNKCISIPNAAAIDKLIKKDEPNFNKTPIKNLIVFGYNPYVKGLDLVFDALEVINKDETKCKLLISAQELTYKYTESRYGNNIPSWAELLEPTENVSEIYNRADIMISSSRREGFSFCLLEALYSGLPSVYSDIPGTNWADEMKGVYRFESGNANDLIRAINECMEHSVTKNEQEHNRKLITEKYSLDVWTEKFIKLFNSILK